MPGRCRVCRCAVHCRIDSSENQNAAVPVFDPVHCRIGSSEKPVSANRIGPPGLVGPRHAPHIESGTHHCRSGRRANHTAGACGRGNAVPAGVAGGMRQSQASSRRPSSERPRDAMPFHKKVAFFCMAVSADWPAHRAKSDTRLGKSKLLWECSVPGTAPTDIKPNTP